jgi:hypothetical protein
VVVAVEELEVPPVTTKVVAVVAGVAVLCRSIVFQSLRELPIL